MPKLFQLYTLNVLCLVVQSCLTLCDPMDGSPPGFSVHGIFQARELEWVVISFSAKFIFENIKACERKKHTTTCPLGPPTVPPPSRGALGCVEY